MSLFNNSKNKDKKKGNSNNTGKPGQPSNVGKSNSKSAAKNSSRITSRSQRGS
ncbi:MAG: hypothetical protein QM731_04405 [Chitinophagaceae bacterium]